MENLYDKVLTMKKIKLLFQGDSITDWYRNWDDMHDLGRGYAKYAAELLKESGVVSKTLDGIKILGRGELTKKLEVKVAKFSASAVEKIEKAGGKAEVI